MPSEVADTDAQAAMFKPEQGDGKASCVCKRHTRLSTGAEVASEASLQNVVRPTITTAL